GVHFVTYDGNGNVWTLVSASTGTETARYEYGPFGEPLRLTGAAAGSNPFRFSTKRSEDATGLVLYEYRAYSPALGRWLSRDPLEESGGANIYAALINSPIEDVDVEGLATHVRRPSTPPPRRPPMPNPPDIVRRALVCAAKCAVKTGMEKIGDKVNFNFLCGKLMRMCQEREDKDNKGLPSFEELTQGEDLALGKELTQKFVGCVVDCLASPGYNVSLQITNGSIVCDYTRRRIRISFDYEVTLDWAGAVHVVYTNHVGQACPRTSPAFRDCCEPCRP
ncbi:RHS repeat domain-containing protein, partial [Limisphaera ngatamarikiensis]|uniref:RHS repeat domain-containing protein n=1 Tax=Limisphaera ngatamarikiensis TaxID=1324935 RepID=UPI00197F4143